MPATIIPDGRGNLCHMGAVTVPVLDSSAAEISHMISVFRQIEMIWINACIGNGDKASGASPATCIGLFKATGGGW